MMTQMKNETVAYNPLSEKLFSFFFLNRKTMKKMHVIAYYLHYQLEQNKRFGIRTIALIQFSSYIPRIFPIIIIIAENLSDFGFSHVSVVECYL